MNNLSTFPHVMGVWYGYFFFAQDFELNDAIY